MSSVAHKQLTANDDPNGNGHDLGDTATLEPNNDGHDMPDALPSLKPPTRPTKPPDEITAEVLTRLKAKPHTMNYTLLTFILEDLLPAGTRGLLPTSIVLAQLIYWHGKGHNGEWTYKRDGELIHETGLSTKELRRAKQLLRRSHLVVITYRGVPPIPWYRVDMHKLRSYIRRNCGTDKWDGRA